MPQTLAKPLIDLIADNVVSELNQATVASGYHYDITAERGRLGGNKMTHGKCVVAIGDSIREEDAPNGYDQYLTTIIIIGNIIEAASAEEDIPLDTAVQMLAGDIITATCSNDADLTRGGYAIDTTPGDTRVTELDFPNYHGTVEQELLVRHRHPFGRPFVTPFED